MEELEFIFDRLIDRQNICGLKKEAQEISKFIKQKQNILLYAPRNFGKTSLVKNIIIPDFQKTHKNSFVFFADLMGVKDLASINLRLNNALAVSLKESFPVTSIFSNIGKYFQNLQPTIGFDQAGQASFSIASAPQNKEKNIGDIFQTINQLNQDYPCLIVIDEFQDISFVEEAESLFRNAFQQISNLSIIVLGSKRHLLKNIFAMPDSPLANWGKDINIDPIDYEEYYDYIVERFEQKGLKIDFELSKYIQDEMQRVPESINMLCYEIYQNYKNQEIDAEIVQEMSEQLIDSKRKRFETLLSVMSIAEEKVAIQIADNDANLKPQSKEFCQKVNLTARSVKLNIDKLMNQGLIDFEEGKYYICDPLFRFYLRKYRVG